MPPNACARYSPKPIRVSSVFRLAEASFFTHALGVSAELADRLDIGGEPSQSVNGVLLGLDSGVVEPAVGRRPFA